MADRGRIVVVAAGFALWAGGRCVAAARFSDIRRLRAVRATGTAGTAGTAPDAFALRVELTDGSLMELRDEAPGFELFLDRAATMLTGLLPYAAWHSTLLADDTPVDGVLLFERPRGR